MSTAFVKKETNVIVLIYSDDATVVEYPTHNTYVVTDNEIETTIAGLNELMVVYNLTLPDDYEHMKYLAKQNLVENIWEISLNPNWDFIVAHTAQIEKAKTDMKAWLL